MGKQFFRSQGDVVPPTRAGSALYRRGRCASWAREAWWAGARQAGRPSRCWPGPWRRPLGRAFTAATSPFRTAAPLSTARPKNNASLQRPLAGSHSTHLHSTTTYLHAAGTRYGQEAAKPTASNLSLWRAVWSSCSLPTSGMPTFTLAQRRPPSDMPPPFQYFGACCMTVWCCPHNVT